MRDSYHDILKAFYTALNGNVIYGGATIPVYTGLPKINSGEPYDYIYISEQTQQDWGGADMFGFEETMTIQIVCRGRGDTVSRVKVSDISTQVMNLLKPTYLNELSVDNFNMIGLFLDNSFTDFEVTDEDYAIRKIQRWRYFLSETTIADGIGVFRIGTTFIVA